MNHHKLPEVGIAIDFGKLQFANSANRKPFPAILQVAIP